MSLSSSAPSPSPNPCLACPLAYLLSLDPKFCFRQQISNFTLLPNDVSVYGGVNTSAALAAALLASLISPPDEPPNFWP